MSTPKLIRDIKEILETHNAHKNEKASLTKAGHVQLSNATNSTDETMAATLKALKSVYDFANANKAKIVQGSYTGDGATTREINLGFAPSLVYLGYSNSSTFVLGIKGFQFGWRSNENNAAKPYRTPELTSTGFIIGKRDSGEDLNFSGALWTYLAIGG